MQLIQRQHVCCESSSSERGGEVGDDLVIGNQRREIGRLGETPGDIGVDLRDSPTVERFMKIEPHHTHGSGSRRPVKMT
jgi:hypothetical protein